MSACVGSGEGQRRGALCRHGLEEVGADVEAGGEGVGEGEGECSGGVGRGEGDDAAAEPAAGHSGADNAGRLVGEVGGEVELGAGDAEVVAERGVGIPEQGSQGGEIGGGERAGGVAGALVLSDDVACGAVLIGGEPRASAFDKGEAALCFGVSEERDLEGEGGLFAGVASFGVFAAGEGVLDAGVDNHDAESGRDWDGVGVLGETVDEERVPRAAEHGDELVHDAAGDAGELVLGESAGVGLVVGVEVLGGGEFGECGEGDFERGRGGEPRAERDIGGDGDVGGGHDDAATAHLFEDTQGVGGEGAAERGVWGDGRAGLGVGVDGGVGGGDADEVVGAWSGEGDGVAVDSHGEDEAAGVVGVFADEVDASGGASGPGG